MRRTWKEIELEHTTRLKAALARREGITTDHIYCRGPRRCGCCAQTVLLLELWSTLRGTSEQRNAEMDRRLKTIRVAMSGTTGTFAERAEQAEQKIRIAYRNGSSRIQ